MWRTIGILKKNVAYTWNPNESTDSTDREPAKGEHTAVGVPLNCDHQVDRVLGCTETFVDSLRTQGTQVLNYFRVLLRLL